MSILLTLEIVSVDPVQNVESSVRSQSKKIVRSDRLGLASFLHHEQLGQNGHRLQVDGERPQDFHKAELVVEQQRQNGAGAKEKFDPEINC